MNSNSIFLVVAIGLFFLTSCGNNSNKSNNTSQGVNFNPQKKETIVEFSPKKINPSDNYNEYIGATKVSIMVPDYLSTNCQNILTNKLIQLSAQCGMGNFGGDGSIILFPTFSEIERGLTSTVPQKTMLKYDITLSVGNTYSGDIYASANTSLVGVGDTEELAMSSIISSLDVGGGNFKEMMKTADEAIIQYYSSNGTRLISTAKSYASSGDFEEAFALLNSIPMAAGNCYDNAQVEMATIYKQYLNANAEVLFSMMQALISEASDEDGYSPEAIAYYVMIPEGTPAKAKADKLFAEYRANISETAKRKAQEAKEQMEREHKLAVEMKRMDVQLAQIEAESEQKQRESDYRMAEKELEAKIAIDGQTALLEKYKADAAYERLPWLRKLVHLGKYDKFDGR